MIRTGSGSYETMKEAGYEHLSYDPLTKEHILLHKETNQKEIFVARKYFAGWAIIYKNTHLEFCGNLRWNSKVELDY